MRVYLVLSGIGGVPGSKEINGIFKTKEVAEDYIKRYEELHEETIRAHKILEFQLIESNEIKPGTIYSRHPQLDSTVYIPAP
jgi:hypothetical protein